MKLTISILFLLLVFPKMALSQEVARVDVLLGFVEYASMKKHFVNPQALRSGLPHGDHVEVPLHEIGQGMLRGDWDTQLEENGVVFKYAIVVGKIPGEKGPTYIININTRSGKNEPVYAGTSGRLPFEKADGVSVWGQAVPTKVRTEAPIMYVKGTESDSARTLRLSPF